MIEDVALEVAQTAVVNITLQVGTVNESIGVRADPVLLETSDASLSQVIDDKRLLALPINGRNFMQLVSLSAGVINAGRASATQRQANYGPAFSVGGQRDNTSVVLIDGMEISGQELNNYPLAIPPLDSLAEFRVQTANYPAEFGGNSGAVINVVSKRGSNDFHATLFEFLRNDALDARNLFSATVDPLRRNQFGFVAGGPVVVPGLYNGRNKLFWMFSYEGTRRRQAVTTTTLVPTLKERAGDFSGLPATIVDPAHQNSLSRKRHSGEPGSTRSVPHSSLCIPLRTTRTRRRNYIGHPSGVSDNDVLAAAHRLPGWKARRHLGPLHGEHAIRSRRRTGAVAGISRIRSGTVGQQPAAGLSATCTPSRRRSINEVNVGFVRFRRERHSVDAFTRNWIQELGIKGLSPDPLTWAAPSMTPDGYPEIGYSSNNAVFKWVTDSVQIVDNFAAVRGAHSVKAGLTLQFKRLSTVQWGQPNGSVRVYRPIQRSGAVFRHISLQCAGRPASRISLELFSPDHAVFAPPLVYAIRLVHSGRLEADAERHGEYRPAVGILRPPRGA